MSRGLGTKRFCRCPRAPEDRVGQRQHVGVAQGVGHLAHLGGGDLGGTTCLIRSLSTTASFVLCVFGRAEEHHNLQNCSPLLKEESLR